MRMAVVDCASRSAIPRAEVDDPSDSRRFRGRCADRIELQDLPEATYHDVDEVVAAVENRVGRLTATSKLPDFRCCE